MSELASLVNDTLLFLKQEGFVFHPKKSEQPHTIPVNKQKKAVSPPPLPENPRKSSEERAPVTSKVKEDRSSENSNSPTSNEKSLKTTEWSLEPMSTPSFEQPTFNYPTNIIQPSVPVILILPLEKAAHRLFLENVARAITRQLAPARVLLASEKIDSSVRLILRPDNNHPPHKLYESNGVTILPLEDLDRYLNDRNLKLSLWNLLKTFPNSRLSS